MYSILIKFHFHLRILRIFISFKIQDNNRKLLRDILRKVGLYKPELQKIIEGTEKKTYSIPELGADDSDERRDLEDWNELRKVQSEKEVLEMFRLRFQNKFKANPQINLSTHGFAKQVLILFEIISLHWNGFNN